MRFCVLNLLLNLVFKFESALKINPVHMMKRIRISRNVLKCVEKTNRLALGYHVK